MGDIAWSSGGLARQSWHAGFLAPQVGCSDLSFTYPGWELRDFTLQGDYVEFYLDSLIDSQLDVYCSDRPRSTCDQDPKENCASPAGIDGSHSEEAHFSFDRETSALMINQTWSCEDRGYPFTFTGTGETMLRIDCVEDDTISNETTCKGADQRVLASLLVPAHINPQSQAPIPPPGHDNVGCRVRSESRAPFVLKDLSFVHSERTPPSPIPFVNLQELTSYNVTNQATGQTQRCSGGASNSGSVFDPSGWYACISGDGLTDDDDDGNYDIVTVHSWDNATQRLAINQTWYCDEDPQHPLQYTAFGEAKNIPTNCTRSYPLFEVREECSMPDVNMTIVDLEVIELPPDALNRPKLVEHSCTIASFVDMSFEISDFQFPERYWSNSYDWFNNTPVVITMENKGLGDGTATARNGHYPVSLDGPIVPLDETWQNCESFRFPGGLIHCSLRFNRVTGVLAVNQTWQCSDKDSQHPIFFNATGTGKVPWRECDCSDSEEYCPPDAPFCLRSDNFTLPITEHTWWQNTTEP
ncbi:hypothetical protein F4778DRAFT_750365 [Xylariomycetidae sp. FL2044]|nr:hypothetical protein F4778DRAFT_750365 [Xylariomycetidae sp. FL2044]